MVIRGRVQNGIVVLENEDSLPEGAEVTVVPCSAPEAAPERMSQEEHRRIREISDRIAAMPDENPGDTFSGTDHDKTLYGEP